MLQREITDGFVEQLNLNVSISDSIEALTVAKNGLGQAQMDYLAGPLTEKALHIEKSGDMDELKRAIAAVVLDIHLVSAISINENSAPLCFRRDRECLDDALRPYLWFRVYPLDSSAPSLKA
jgi:hypothetical protein